MFQASLAVGVGIGPESNDEAPRTTIARLRTTTVITRNESASLPALIGAI